eukprot:XP_001690742.1 flavin-containing monooxygenase [Chlamydomonas reinhardtii]
MVTANVLPAHPTTVVVGAGLSGLQTAAQFLALGHRVCVLERAEDVGGVWLRYTSFNIQGNLSRSCHATSSAFQTSPARPSWSPRSTPRNQLYRHIIFRAHVTRLHRLAGAWQCFYDVEEPLPGGGGGGGGADGMVVQHRMTADFVVVATGLHSTPAVPPIECPHLFRGQMLHAYDLPPDEELPEQLAGCRVVILGGGKVAVDTATRLAAAGAASTAVVFKQAHWPITRFPLDKKGGGNGGSSNGSGDGGSGGGGGSSTAKARRSSSSSSSRGPHFTSLLYNRWAGAMLDPYYDAGLAGRAAGAVTRPLRRLFWRRIEKSLLAQNGLTRATHGGSSGGAGAGVGSSDAAALLPPLPLDRDLLTGGLVHDGQWSAALASGEVTAIRGEPHRFTPDGLLLRCGTVVPADVVVLATGYRKDYGFIDADILTKLGGQRDGLYLYRHVLPPLVRNIAFVGCEASSFNSPLTSYLQCMWLASCLQNRVRLPPPAEMMKDLQRQMRWQRRVLPPQADRAAQIGIYTQHYHDTLLRDMGLSPRRKPNLWRECFEPYTAADFRDLPFLGLGPDGGVRSKRSGSAAAAAASARASSAATAAQAQYADHHHHHDASDGDGEGEGGGPARRIRISAAAAAAVAGGAYVSGDGGAGAAAGPSVGFALPPPARLAAASGSETDGRLVSATGSSGTGGLGGEAPRSGSALLAAALASTSGGAGGGAGGGGGGGGVSGMSSSRVLDTLYEGGEAGGGGGGGAQAAESAHGPATGSRMRPPGGSSGQLGGSSGQLGSSSGHSLLPPHGSGGAGVGVGVGLAPPETPAGMALAASALPGGAAVMASAASLGGGAAGPASSGSLGGPGRRHGRLPGSCRGLAVHVGVRRRFPVRGGRAHLHPAPHRQVRERCTGWWWWCVCGWVWVWWGSCKYQPNTKPKPTKTRGVQAEALVASDSIYGMWAEASWSSRASGAGDKCRRPGSMVRTTAQDRHADATSKTHELPGDQESSPDARQGASGQERDMWKRGTAKIGRAGHSERAEACRR